jgi:hypothetical protein
LRDASIYVNIPRFHSTPLKKVRGVCMKNGKFVGLKMILALVPTLFVLGGCAVQESSSPGAARQSADKDDQEYVTGSRIPVRDKTQTGAQTTSTDIQSSARGN